MPLPEEDPPNDASKRHRKRRNVIGSSPHRDEYTKLMKLGWSAMAISRFALFRHGEDIPDRTIRAYRKKYGWDVITSDMRRNGEEFAQVDPEAILDIMAERTELIRLQKTRIGIDHAHEVRMNKLFSGTRHEIEALNRLVNDAKTDMQDFGLFPKLGEVHRVQVAGAVQGLTPSSGAEKPDDGSRDRYAPPAQTLGALFQGEVAPEHEQQLARMLHMILPGGDPQVNGHGVVDGEVEAG